MKRKILSYLLLGMFGLLSFGMVGGNVYAQADKHKSSEEGSKSGGECKGIKLNTNFPIIGNCIESKNATGAFPTMMGALAKIVVSLILVVCFILIIYAGILWSMDKPKEAKDWIKRVAITILLLGFSGVILRLVNPNFFG